jgi:hypothetical protein
MNIASLRDISALERVPRRRARARSSESTATASDVSALAAMLDYAIAEGAKMRMPLFVCLLRLALLALKEEAGEARKLQRLR